jgi:ribonuclease HI
MLKIYIDGGARGNPGPAAVGFVVFDESGIEQYRYGRPIGTSTNNCAEYTALIDVLQYLKPNGDGAGPKTAGHDDIVVYSDSELLVRQITGRYRVRDTKLIPLFQQVLSLLESVGNIRFVHVPRSSNRIADGIVNRVLDGRDSITGTPLRSERHKNIVLKAKRLSSRNNRCLAFQVGPGRGCFKPVTEWVRAVR